MENTNSTLDIGALNEKIERESAFVDILSLENEQSDRWPKTYG